jgi:hypothetical protein
VSGCTWPLFQDSELKPEREKDMKIKLLLYTFFIKCINDDLEEIYKKENMTVQDWIVIRRLCDWKSQLQETVDKINNKKTNDIKAA